MGFLKENKISKKTGKYFLEYLTTTNGYFSSLPIKDLSNILKFIFYRENAINNNRIIIYKKIDIILKYKDNLANMWDYLNDLNKLPENYFVSIFSENSVSYDKNFFNLLKRSDTETVKRIISFIENVNSNYNDQYYKILNSNVFNGLEFEIIDLALNKIETIKEEEIDGIAKNEKNILVMMCANLDDCEILEKSYSFIEKDKDTRLISTKINCIKSIIPYLEKGYISKGQYFEYLEILSNDLEDNTILEQTHILESKTNFFEKTNSYSNIGRINSMSISLLKDEKNRNSSTYNFIEKTVTCYDDLVTEQIISLLSNINNESDRKTFVDFVLDDFFISSDEKRQKTLLDLFDNKKLKINFQEAEESIISVSPYIYNVVSNSSEPLEFVNNKTGLKIFVKSKK